MVTLQKIDGVLFVQFTNGDQFPIQKVAVILSDLAAHYSDESVTLITETALYKALEDDQVIVSESLGIVKRGAEFDTVWSLIFNAMRDIFEHLNLD